MVAISARVSEVVSKMFPQEERSRVLELLANECGDNLAFSQDTNPQNADRIRLAVLKLSEGDFGRLASQVAQAKKDWRDVLMAAGFGHDVTAHIRWEPQ
jgi:hypothetical protein